MVRQMNDIRMNDIISAGSRAQDTTTYRSTQASKSTSLILSRHRPNHGGFLLCGVVGSMHLLVAKPNLDLVRFLCLFESLFGGSASLEPSTETLTDAVHLLSSFPAAE